MMKTPAEAVDEYIKWCEAAKTIVPVEAAMRQGGSWEITYEVVESTSRDGASTTWMDEVHSILVTRFCV